MELKLRFRLLTCHFGFFQLGSAVAGGFVGAHLLKLGFSLSQALLAFACLFLLRSALRLACVTLVRRISFRRALLLGTFLGAVQFAPIIAADEVLWLLAWIGLSALAEALYWPIYHAAAAVTGGGASRGREIGLRTAVGAGVGVVGPLLGGLLFAWAGPATAFGVAAGAALLSALPLLLITTVEAGAVPTAREAATVTDWVGFVAFAADGLVASGLAIAWPMILFISIGAQFEVFGLAGAMAGMAGAAAGLVCGRAIDQGSRSRLVPAVCCALALGILIRAISGWFPMMSIVANTTGAVIMGFYVPVLISTVYDRAKASGQAYRFHLSAEAGWDCGAACGCLAASMIVFGSAVASLAVLPAMVGALVLRAVLQGRASVIGPAQAG